MMLGDSKGAIETSVIEDNLTSEHLFKYIGIKDNDIVNLTKVRGKKYYDFLTAGYSYLCLGSTKFWRLIEYGKFTGIRPINVSVYGLTNFDYKLCSVVGRCGPIINELSVSVEKKLPLDSSKNYKTWMGLYFDLLTWDGSDFFSSRDTNHTFVTKKVVEILTENSISNVEFIPISEVENFDLLFKN